MKNISFDVFIVFNVLYEFLLQDETYDYFTGLEYDRMWTSDIYWKDFEEMFWEFEEVRSNS